MDDEQKEYLTKEKYEELTEEYKRLTTVRRKEVAASLEYAKSLGDLSENAEYHEARDEQAKLEDRISRLEMVLKNAEIIEHKKGNVVTIGSTVELQKKGGAVKIYTIVGSEEADMASGKLSDHSPIGKALMGKKKGDVVECVTPGGAVECTILSVT